MISSTSQELLRMISKAVEEIEDDTSQTDPNGGDKIKNTRREELELNFKQRAAIRTLQAATHQLLANLVPTGLRFQELYLGFFQIVAMDIVARGRIADSIHSIDPDSSKGGVHLDILAQKAGILPDKLKHLLRFLALQNIFCEFTPNYWCNNPGSEPLRIHSKNSQWNAIGFFREDVAIPALLELPNVLFKNNQDELPHQTAFQRYYKTDLDFFDYLSESDEGQKAKRFSKAMIETAKAKAHGDETAPYKEFQWGKKFGQKGTLIDVGGGMGSAAYAISSYLPEWNIIIQDRPEVIQVAKENFERIKSSANLQFEIADFLQEQPDHRFGGADVYFLRNILHDWPFKFCVEILTHLRNAAKPTSRLLVCEMMIRPATYDAESPILSNEGMASLISHSLNLTMLTLFNSEERGLADFSNIFRDSGWVLVESVPLASIDRFIFEGVPDVNWIP